MLTDFLNFFTVSILFVGCHILHEICNKIDDIYLKQRLTDVWHRFELCHQCVKV